MMRSACNLMPRSSSALSANHRDLARVAVLAIFGLIGLWPACGVAQGVPTVDGKAIILHGEEASRETALRTELETQNAKRAKLSRLHDDQIAALDATLAMLTGSSAFIGDLEGLGGGLAASEAYAVDDNNPYANRLFGDARVTIEQMIILTAQKYGGHPALEIGRAHV